MAMHRTNRERKGTIQKNTGDVIMCERRGEEVDEVGGLSSVILQDVGVDFVPWR